MFAACEHGDLDAVCSLLAADANPNRAQKSGATALIIACQHDHAEIASALLMSNADINQPTVLGMTALWCASANHATAAATVLITAGAALDTEVRGHKSTGATALFMACRTNNTALVLTLLHFGADANIRLRSGPSPLFTACANDDNPTIIDALLRSGADPRTPLSPLHPACRRGRLHTVRKLLLANADPNSARADGVTPLISTVCWAGSLAVVRSLLCFGADPALMTASGWAPRRLAGHLGSLAIAGWLASVEGQTAYQISAAACDEVQMIALLRGGCARLCAKSADKRCAAIALAAVAAWSPERHYLYPARVRSTVALLLHIEVRLRGGTLTRLPREMWLALLAAL
jgi:ankyrin repeat protein